MNHSKHAVVETVLPGYGRLLDPPELGDSVYVLVKNGDVNHMVKVWVRCVERRMITVYAKNATCSFVLPWTEAFRKTKKEKKMQKQYTIKDDKKEVPTEVLATSIVAISNSMKELKQGRLNNRALLTLLQASTGLPKRDIENVLSGLENLERDYVRVK